MADFMLLSIPGVREASYYFYNMLNYIDLLVLMIRPLFPYTVTLIFSVLWTGFSLTMVLIFIGIIKRLIPFFGSSKSTN